MGCRIRNTFVQKLERERGPQGPCMCMKTGKLGVLRICPSLIDPFHLERFGRWE